jgi:hypothetical protein
VYVLKQNKKNHFIYPLKVVDEEKSDHFDLLLITDGDKITIHTFQISHALLEHKKRIIKKKFFSAIDASHHSIINPLKIHYMDKQH